MTVYPKLNPTTVSGAQRMVGLFQWKIGFKLPNFYLKCKMLLVFFFFLFLVQNGQGDTGVACIGLRERSKWALGCERAFLEVFLDLL